MATETKTQSPAKADAKPARSVTPFEEVSSQLLSESSKKQFMMALPPQMPVDRFIRVAITAINQTPALLECDRASLYRAFMRCAQDGLLPDGQEAAIAPFAGQAQYMPMVKGILKKIRNSGELKAITAQIVHKADKFKYWVDDSGEHLEHEPELLSGVDRGEIVGVYALAKTKDDAVYIEVMSVADVEKVRAISKIRNGVPWTQWWDQMAKKTAIRRLSKRLPMSTDLDDLIRRDDDLYDVDAQVKDTDPKAAGKKGNPNRLQRMMGSADEILEHDAGQEPLVTVDEDSPEAVAEREKVVARHRELEAQKKKLQEEANNGPSKEEQAEIQRKEAFDAKEYKCVKCPPYTFATDSDEEITVHMQTKHPQPPKDQKKTNGGAKGATEQGGIFG